MTDTPTDREREAKGAADRKSLRDAITTYQIASNAIVKVGYDKARSIAHEVEMPDADVTTNRLAILEQKDLLTAIDQGMSLHEYLEFDSATSWLDREQSNDDNTDSNTGAEPA